MSDILNVIKDFSGPVNSLLLAAILWMIRELRVDMKYIREQEIPHILERLGRLEGRNEETDAARSSRT